MQSVMVSKLLLRSEYCCSLFLSACSVLRCAIALHNGVSFFEEGYRGHGGYHLNSIIYAADFSLYFEFLLDMCAACIFATSGMINDSISTAG
jgi:hypothetical protein